MNLLYAEVHDEGNCSICGGAWGGKNPAILVLRECRHYDALCDECASMILASAASDLLREVTK